MILTGLDSTALPSPARRTRHSLLRVSTLPRRMHLVQRELAHFRLAGFDAHRARLRACMLAVSGRGRPAKSGMTIPVLHCIIRVSIPEADPNEIEAKYGREKGK